MRRPAAGRLSAAAALLLLFTTGPGRSEDGWRLTGLEGGSLSEADVARGATIAVVWASWSPRSRSGGEMTYRAQSTGSGVS